MRKSRHQGGRLGLTPDDDWHGAEFFYLIQGRLTGEMSGRTVELRAGSVLAADRIKETVIFTAQQDSLLLYVTSRPTFHHLSEPVQELMRLVVAASRSGFSTSPGR